METYRRIATPIAVIILTMIGAVIASRKVRGAAAHIAIGIVFAASFILMDRFSTIFSTKTCHPTSLPDPDFIFIFVAIYVYKAPK